MTSVRAAPAQSENERAVQTIRVLIQRLDHYPDEWLLPAYATPGSAAVDLRNAGGDLRLEPLARQLVPTGLALALPPGTEAQIRPRSGLALRHGIGIINSPCTIDSDYRGEIKIPLINFDKEDQVIAHGERIAQMLVASIARIEWEHATTLPPSERGSGGFGSTGR